MACKDIIGPYPVQNDVIAIVPARPEGRGGSHLERPCHARCRCAGDCCLLTERLARL
ncbi:MAG TPA: hypothetical protein GX700_13890 [Paracoccus sp.]|nr:hypothetical protein [Paracoccus sp. (in: a-proteobacteria)]